MPASYAEHIAPKLKALRESAGFRNQSEFGRALGLALHKDRPIPQATISAWEMGVNEPTIEIISAWVEVCGAEFHIEFPKPQDRSASALADRIVALPAEERAAIVRLVDADPEVKAVLKLVLAGAEAGAELRKRETGP